MKIPVKHASLARAIFPAVQGIFACGFVENNDSASPYGPWKTGQGFRAVDRDNGEHLVRSLPEFSCQGTFSAGCYNMFGAFFRLVTVRSVVNRFPAPFGMSLRVLGCRHYRHLVMADQPGKMPPSAGWNDTLF